VEGPALTAPWWQRAVVYQIYPRSFADGDGDGIGDLRGLRGRLDHLVELGVDALWLSPVFRSPMADFGYDVSDYCDIDPVFGSLADMDALLEAAHERGLRVLLDWVPNHSSDQHPWFVESRAAREDPKASGRTEAAVRPRDAWPTWVLSNHDVPRHRTRYGTHARARAAAVLLLTLRERTSPVGARCTCAFSDP
jgi:glycosidase